MKLIIADDSAIIRRHLISLIQDNEKIEYIGEAKDAPEAVEQVRELEPEVVILDVRMPGGGGIGALEHIRSFNPTTDIIVLTNYPYPQYKQRCLDAGATYFLDKSTEFDKIHEVLDEIALRRGFSRPLAAA